MSTGRDDEDTERTRLLQDRFRQRDERDERRARRAVRQEADAARVREVYAELLRSYDEGVAEFLDLERVKPNTLGNHRMLRTL